MRIYNSKSLKVEEFKPIKEGEVSMYVCGPTVYSDMHIGNARPMVVFDTLKRVFEALGYKVKYVSNYTDVDDKIIKEAAEKNISELELTNEMIERVKAIRELLNASDLYKTPRVTETMEDIEAFIEDLVMNGYAYQVGGDVYFRTASIKDYGLLANQKIEDFKVGARIEENTNKESPLDFTLWKKTETGIRWPFKYSLGRPGWHTECVVMIKKELGDVIDIHGGGKDLRFPHHENERAQARALYGTDLANYWVHNGMIDIEGVKMSKSLGNFITAQKAIEAYGAMTIRWLLLSNHYRDDINISSATLEAAQKELDRSLSAIKQASLKLSLNSYEGKEREKKSYDAFISAMEDDLNTPNAFSVVFEVTKKINTQVRQKEADLNALSKDLESLKAMLDILGICYHEVHLDEEDRDLYDAWQKAKEVKDFAKADEYRQILKERDLL